MQSTSARSVVKNLAISASTICKDMLAPLQSVTGSVIQYTILVQLLLEFAACMPHNTCELHEMHSVGLVMRDWIGRRVWVTGTSNSAAFFPQEALAKLHRERSLLLAK